MSSLVCPLDLSIANLQHNALLLLRCTTAQYMGVTGNCDDAGGRVFGYTAPRSSGDHPEVHEQAGEKRSLLLRSIMYLDAHNVLAILMQAPAMQCL